MHCDCMWASCCSSAPGPAARAAVTAALIDLNRRDPVLPGKGQFKIQSREALAGAAALRRHMTHIHRRESVRHHGDVSPAPGLICSCGIKGAPRPRRDASLQTKAAA